MAFKPAVSSRARVIPWAESEAGVPGLLMQVLSDIWPAEGSSAEAAAAALVAEADRARVMMKIIRTLAPLAGEAVEEIVGRPAIGARRIRTARQARDQLALLIVDAMQGPDAGEVARVLAAMVLSGAEVGDELVERVRKEAAQLAYERDNRAALLASGPRPATIERDRRFLARWGELEAAKVSKEKASELLAGEFHLSKRECREKLKSGKLDQLRIDCAGD